MKQEKKRGSYFIVFFLLISFILSFNCFFGVNSASAATKKDTIKKEKVIKDKTLIKKKQKNLSKKSQQKIAQKTAKRASVSVQWASSDGRSILHSSSIDEIYFRESHNSDELVKNLLDNGGTPWTLTSIPNGYSHTSYSGGSTISGWYYGQQNPKYYETVNFADANFSVGADCSGNEGKFINFYDNAQILYCNMTSKTWDSADTRYNVVQKYNLNWNSYSGFQAFIPLTSGSEIKITDTVADIPSSAIIVAKIQRSFVIETDAGQLNYLCNNSGCSSVTKNYQQEPFGKVGDSILGMLGRSSDGVFSAVGSNTYRFQGQWKVLQGYNGCLEVNGCLLDNSSVFKNVDAKDTLSITSGVTNTPNYIKIEPVGAPVKNITFDPTLVNARIDATTTDYSYSNSSNSSFVVAAAAGNKLLDIINGQKESYASATMADWKEVEYSAVGLDPNSRMLGWQLVKGVGCSQDYCDISSTYQIQGGEIVVPKVISTFTFKINPNTGKGADSNQEPIMWNCLVGDNTTTLANSECLNSKNALETELFDNLFRPAINYKFCGWGTEEDATCKEAGSSLDLNKTPGFGQVFAGGTLEIWAIWGTNSDSYVEPENQDCTNSEYADSHKDECYKIIPCKYDPLIDSKDAECHAPISVCEYNSNLQAGDKDCVKPKSKPIVEPVIVPCLWDKNITSNDQKCKNTIDETPKLTASNDGKLSETGINIDMVLLVVISIVLLGVSLKKSQELKGKNCA
ncbi:MAG: hypothetical protein LBM13_01610 [Candidatus Ancillula sp.]|jgi:hypothetical protein|nr:hypothetical protein [Candidatus Ancillula sp.]